MSYDKTNTFSLGKGDKNNPEHADKDTSKWPDYKGLLNVNGVEYYLSAWIQTNSKTGEKFLSGALKAKEEQSVAAPSKNVLPDVDPDFDDGINF